MRNNYRCNPAAPGACSQLTRVYLRVSTNMMHLRKREQGRGKPGNNVVVLVDDERNLSVWEEWNDKKRGPNLQRRLGGAKEKRHGRKAN